MDCTDVSTILDERRETRLTRAEHCAVDAHLGSCVDCARAWHAQAQLRALPIPPAPADLLARVLAAHAPSPPRRATPRIVLGIAILAGGAALAAVTYVTVRERADGDTAASVASPPPAARPSAAAVATNTPSAAAPAAGGTGAAADPRPLVDRSLLPDSDYFLVSRTPPTYPPRALEQGRHGAVQAEFTITAEGRVADAVALEPSDAEFVPAALAALSQWMYLPRVIDGERVAVHGVQTAIRFQLVPDGAPAPPPNQLSRRAFSLPAEAQDRVRAAWRCVAALELRCAELILDEMVATYELTADDAPTVWDFYGYLYTQYGDYGRAIAAYEASVASGKGWDGAWLALAHLYFTRSQYDLALKTLLRYKQEAGDNDYVFPGTEEFVEKLRLLGITEDVL